MTATLQLIDLDGFGPVIVTEGMLMSNGRRIYGVFASEASARSERADHLALATIGAERLTDEQREIAARNSEAL